MTTADSAAFAASMTAGVRKAIAACIQHYGSKRGRAQAAAKLAREPRWLRSLMRGESARVTNEIHLRALLARQEIALAQAAQARAELEEIKREAALHAHEDLDHRLRCMDFAG